MHKYKIELITQSDIAEFVNIASTIDGDVRLTDDTGFCVSAKSLLGAMLTAEWSTLYCISENDIYSKIQRFCVS